MRSFRVAVHSLFVKIVSADPGHPALGLLCKSYLAGKAVRSSSGNGKRRGLNSRLILPYHPSLSRVNSLLQDVTADFNSLGFSHLAPWVTWSLHKPSIMRKLLADSRTKLCAREV